MNEFSSSRVYNLTDTPLFEFRPGDLLYVSRMESGYKIIYKCRFLEYRRGNVRVRVIQCESDHREKYQEGDTFSVRATKCFLWGRNHAASHASCHWWNGKEWH